MTGFEEENEDANYTAQREIRLGRKVVAQWVMQQ